MKACRVGIGIIPINGFKPLAVLGSGFFVNSQGFVMTAAHVFESCKYVYEEFARNHVKTFVGAIQVNLETNAFDINVLPLNIIKTSKTEVKSVLGIENIDIGIGIPKDYSKTVPFLEIKNPSSSNLYHEIIMSGYPGGDKSLNINENDGMRLSPITQFGRITGFMPTDNTPIPWGFKQIEAIESPHQVSNLTSINNNRLCLMPDSRGVGQEQAYSKRFAKVTLTLPNIGIGLMCRLALARNLGR